MRTHARRPRTGRVALSFAGLALLAAAPSASANVYTDVNDFNVNEWNTYRGTYSSTSNSGVFYRWVDSPWKATYVTSTSCYNNGFYGEAYYSAGNTAYQAIAYLPAGYCFNLWGRTLPGQGSMYFYDGKLYR